MIVGDRRDGMKVEDVSLWVPDRFGVHGFGASGDCGFYFCRVVDVDERDVDAEAAKRDIKLGVCSAVQGLRCDDLVACLGQSEDADELCCLTRRCRERSETSLEGRHSFLECCRCRVPDPGVDVSERLERKQVGSMLGIVEHERRRGIDRHGTGTGLGIGSLTCVDRSRSETELVDVLTHIDSPMGRWLLVDGWMVVGPGLSDPDPQPSGEFDGQRNCPTKRVPNRGCGDDLVM